MKNSDRLFSLDVLRGLDMFLLTVVGPLFWAVDRLYPFSEVVKKQFQHAWGGFTLWDIIMPLFIFMCGAAVPYALGKRLDDNGKPTRAFWGHLFSRFALLWFCGMLVQGNLASLDINKISPYNNTLETIAAGYLIAGLVMLIPLRCIRIAMPIVLLAAYGAMLHLFGDFSKTGNFAAIVEAKILTAIMPAGNEFVRNINNPEIGLPYHGYTWFLTTPMFGFMTLCGAQCTEILRGDWTKPRKAIVLFILGAALLAFGWAIVPWHPMIKHIFTVSFTCQAMGWSVLALALLYLITDVLEFRSVWVWWIFTLFGQCALTAYMVTHFFRPALSGAAEAVCRGVPHLLGADVPELSKEAAKHLHDLNALVVAVVTAVLLTVVLVIRRRARVRPPENHEPITPHLSSALGNGAIPERLQIPGVPTNTPPPDEGMPLSARPVKTIIKLH